MFLLATMRQLRGINQIIWAELINNDYSSVGIVEAHQRHALGSSLAFPSGRTVPSGGGDLKSAHTPVATYTGTQVVVKKG